MAFRFTPQVVNSGKAQIIDTSPLLQAHMMNNQRKHQEMREDKQRAEAEYNYNQDQLADLIGKTKGRDNEQVDNMILETQQWLSELHQRGERVNTPKNKAEYRRRISQIQMTMSRANSTYETYVNLNNAMAQDPYATIDGRQKLYKYYNENDIYNKDVHGLNKIYYDSFNGAKWLADRFEEKDQVEREIGETTYKIYPNVHNIGENGVEVSIDDNNRKAWTMDIPESMKIWYNNRIEEEKKNTATKLAEMEKAGVDMTTKEVKKMQDFAFNENLPVAKQREYILDLEAQKQKRNYSEKEDEGNMSQQKMYYTQRNYEEISDYIMKNDPTGHDVGRVLPFWRGASQDPISIINTGGDSRKIVVTVKTTVDENGDPIPVEDLQKAILSGRKHKTINKEVPVTFNVKDKASIKNALIELQSIKKNTEIGTTLWSPPSLPVPRRKSGYNGGGEDGDN